MKLSKILATKGLQSVTIEVKEGNVFTRKFVLKENGKVSRTTKHFK